MNEITIPTWSSFLWYRLLRHLHRPLRIFHVMVFWYFFFFNILNRYSTCFFNSRGFVFFFSIFIGMVIYVLSESYIFIKYNTYSDINLVITWNVHSILFRLINISNKYYLLFGRVEFCYFIVGNMYKHRHPKIFRWLTSGFSPLNIYSGVLFPRALSVILLWTSTVVIYASSHRFLGKPWSWIMVFIASMIFLFFLHSTPFYLGLWGVLISLLFPASLQKYLNSFEVNSPPFSYLKVLILFSHKFSGRALNSLNL